MVMSFGFAGGAAWMAAAKAVRRKAEAKVCAVSMRRDARCIL
jgi:hypothetical protein